jgi:N-acetylgalactosamine-6-sulfatase
LAKLKELGLDERTLVVFTSDNGAWFGGSTGGLRGMKGTSWEGGYRVPCIARWPGRIAEGKVVDQPAITMDVFATALAAAGIDAPPQRVIDGKDLLPVMAGKAVGAHDVIFGHQGPQLATISDSRWKLHVLPARDNKKWLKAERFIDPRGPDGVTILAPYEQNQPADYPGLRTGDECKAMSLFDLANDPGEQNDVADKNPEVVAKLKARFDEMANQAPGKP